MASTLALGPCITAILAMLRASVALTTYVGTRVYPNDDGDVPSRPACPYVQVETSGETPFNTMGGSITLPKFGSMVRIQVRVVSNTKSDVQANSITSVVKQALDVAAIDVAGYPNACIEFQGLTPLKQRAEPNCPPTREWISDYLVTVHQ